MSSGLDIRSRNTEQVVVEPQGCVRRCLPRDVVRSIDRLAQDELGMTGLVLMENAGRGVVDLLEALGIDAPVAVVCGAGNNGGDGFVIARHLALRGRACRVLLCVPEERLSGDAAINHRVLRESGVPVTRLRDLLEAAPCHSAVEPVASWLDGCGWIVDALLGTGATGAPRGDLPAVIEAINRRAGRVLAVDVPSGLDADTGEAPGACVRALHTATFVGPKLGFSRPGAREFTGGVSVLPIGVPTPWLKRTLDALLANNGRT